MLIRTATPQDLDKIADIHIESWRNSYTDIFPPDFFADKLDSELRNHWHRIDICAEDVVLVAEEANIVGFIAVWCRPSPFIDNLHVTPACRSKKTGTALLKAAAEQLMKNYHREAYLWVFSGNDRAISFYQRLGGVMKEPVIKNIFGHNVKNWRIVWNDLSAIVTNAQSHL